MRLLSWLYSQSGYCASDDIQGLIALSGQGVGREIYLTSPEWTRSTPRTKGDAHCLATYWLYVAKRRADSQDEKEAEGYLLRSAGLLGRTEPSYGALSYAIEQIRKSGLNKEDTEQLIKILSRAKTGVTVSYVVAYGVPVAAVSALALYLRAKK